ncbi:MAG TPA: DegT/DnrJ/EryC1/StrS aminotransferase family protein [Azospirillaceae bacterium]|nr:DegT/DnrJ/EryC1/StrS aminotransferase family protein [Azospirillaceae bacterium]
MTQIPFIDLAAQRRRLGSGLDQAIARVLDHGAFILGPEVQELESRLAAFSGARHAIGCANGTDALVLALMAMGIGPGCAVIVPSFTFAATAEAVALVGAVPLFVDVREDSFNLDAEALPQAIDKAKSLGLCPAAVIAVDLFGHPADYPAIEAACAASGLQLIADAAQSFGASLHGRRVGTFGRLTTTSFFPAKPLGCYGDGGALFTDDDDLATLLRSLRFHGKGADKYDNVRVGLNSRLDTLQAAILLEKLSIFEDELSRRDAVARRYDHGLEGAVATPRVHPEAASAWAQYTIRVAPERRDGLIRQLAAAGVPTALYYPTPLHRQTAYRHHPRARADLPVSDALAASVLSLPMHPYLEPSVQDRIITAIREAVRD